MMQDKMLLKKLDQDAADRSGPFKPKICPNTQELIGLRDKNSKAYDILYDDALRRKDKKSTSFAPEFSFTPSFTNFDPNMFKGVMKNEEKKY